MAIADLVLLPGSKQTLEDLEWLEHRGFSRELCRLFEKGIPLVGICGGFQMLGSLIEDPEGTENEGKPRMERGLGYLPVRTVLRTEKTVRRVRGRMRSEFLGISLSPEAFFQGYEIHVGETVYETGAKPFAEITRDGITGSFPDGALSGSGRVLGTYVHGLFDNDEFRHGLLSAARQALNLAPAETWANVAAEREARIDRLAAHLRKSLDMNLIRSWLIAPAKQ
jgi:adenosylcobyric acid synthase